MQASLPAEAFMRAIPIAAITLLALSSSAIEAGAAGTWCAHLAVPPGSVRCSFFSLEQCQATVWGIGGFCTPNAFAAYRTAREPRRRYRRHY
jgi:hypothetical protein